MVLGNIMRVTKDPEIRRKELMDAAEKLFLEHGYEETAVSDIVKKTGVAQGTFYYYFKSKEAILDAITDKYLDILIERMENIANQENLTAIEKLLAIFEFTSSFTGDHKGIMDYIEEGRCAHLQIKFNQRISSETIKPTARIIQQGIEEGVFNTKYPEEASRAYMGVTALILQGVNDLDLNSPEFMRRFMALFYYIERILGTESGAIINTFCEKGFYKSSSQIGDINGNNGL
ncbi:HTH-type transcriptional regulator BetI [anaerobic digester metagenome]|jgi:AcrR family transcriptional regulator